MQCGGCGLMTTAPAEINPIHQEFKKVSESLISKLIDTPEFEKKKLDNAKELEPLNILSLEKIPVDGKTIKYKIQRELEFCIVESDNNVHTLKCPNCQSVLLTYTENAK